MSSLIKRFICLIALAHLSACAVMSKKDCVNANWEREGYSVGMDGNPNVAEAFAKRKDICAKHNEQADWQQFELGYAQGIEKFCDIPNAVTQGQRGAKRVIEQQICPEDEYFGYEDAFRAGYRWHMLQRKASQANHEYERIRSRASQYSRKLDVLRHQLSSSELSEEQRRSIQYRIRRIRRDLNSLHSDIYYYRDKAIRHQHAADNYGKMLDIEYGEDR